MVEDFVKAGGFRNRRQLTEREESCLISKSNGRVFDEFSLESKEVFKKIWE